jgi:hypothetical protein
MSAQEEEHFPSFLKKKLSEKCVQEIEGQLSSGEKVLHVEVPIFWQGISYPSYLNTEASGASFVVGALGTVAMIIVGAVMRAQAASLMMYLLVFPGLLLYGLLCYWKRKER